MYNRSPRCSERHMEIGSLDMVKNIVKEGGMLMPLMAIIGLLALWALIVILCLYLGQAYDPSLAGKILLH
jgi:hypothetical protein